MFKNLDNLRILFCFQGQNSVYLCCFTRPSNVKACHTKLIYMCAGLKTRDALTLLVQPDVFLLTLDSLVAQILSS